MSSSWLFTYIVTPSRHLRCKPDLFTFSLSANFDPRDLTMTLTHGLLILCINHSASPTPLHSMNHEATIPKIKTFYWRQTDKIVFISKINRNIFIPRNLLLRLQLLRCPNQTQLSRRWRNRPGSQERWIVLTGQQHGTILCAPIIIKVPLCHYA